MKTILVPVDYSEEARHALLFAIGMAQDANLEIVLFHAFHQTIPVASAYQAEEVITGLEQERNEVLKEWLLEIKCDLYKDFCWKFKSIFQKPLYEQDSLNRTESGFHSIEVTKEPDIDISISCISKFGLAGDEIKKAIKDYHIDLVVMAGKRVGPFAHAIMGSTVAAVISDSLVPVLVLPKNSEYKKIKSIVFAADLMELCSNTALNIVRIILQTFQANLQVLYIYQNNDSLPEQQTVKRGLNILDICLYDIDYDVFFWQRENIASGIVEFVEQVEPDMLILSPQVHSFTEVLLNKSVTEAIIHKNSFPFLALPNATNLVTVN